jgi:hypothetical protein
VNYRDFQEKNSGKAAQEPGEKPASYPLQYIEVISRCEHRQQPTIHFRSRQGDWLVFLRSVFDGIRTENG